MIPMTAAEVRSRTVHGDRHPSEVRNFNHASHSATRTGDMNAQQWQIYLALIAAVLAGVTATCITVYINNRITAGRDHVDCRELHRLARWLVRTGYAAMAGADPARLAATDPVGTAQFIIRALDRPVHQVSDPLQPQGRYRGRHWDETVPISGPTPPTVGSEVPPRDRTPEFHAARAMGGR